MPRKRTSQTFNHRLQLALEEGITREVRITLPTPQQAVRFRHELNALRAAMRDAKRDGWERYYEAGVYITPAEPAVVVIKPKVSEFKDALDAAGIPDIAIAPAAPRVQQEDLDKLMFDLMKDLPKAD